MLNQETLEYVVGLDNSGVEEHEGHQFFVNHAGAKRLEFPNVETMTCFSLSQLLNSVKASPPAESEQLLINAISFDKVEVIDGQLNLNQKIDRYALADFSSIYSGFPFGQRMDQESFIVNLMTKFDDSDERTELLQLVTSIRDQEIRTSDDDGYSQVANVKTGVSLVAEKKVKNLWKLRTFKTFPEIEQPVIPYILRLHDGRGSAPQFALYDCDGGAWKVQVTKAIREYCSNWLKSNELADKVVVL